MADKHGIYRKWKMKDWTTHELEYWLRKGRLPK
jgi:hypothetical protein